MPGGRPKGRGKGQLSQSQHGRGKGGGGRGQEMQPGQGRGGPITATTMSSVRDLVADQSDSATAPMEQDSATAIIGVSNPISTASPGGSAEMTGVNNVASSSSELMVVATTTTTDAVQRLRSSGSCVTQSKFLKTKTEYPQFFELQVPSSSSTAQKESVACKVYVAALGENDYSVLTKCGEILVLQKDSYDNLLKHLKRRHTEDPKVAAFLRKHESIKLSTGSAASNEAVGRKGMRSITAWCDVKPYPTTHPRQKAFDNGMLDLFATASESFNIVNKPGFQLLIHGLDPKIKIKSDRTYKRRLEVGVEKEGLPNLIAKLGDTDRRCCHFSGDIWSTKRREAVFGLLAHWINKEWKLEKEVIAFKQLVKRHTGRYISQVFLKCLKEVKFPQNWGGLVVTDSASNMIKCFQLLSFEEGRPEPTEEDDSDEELDGIQESESDDDEEVTVVEAHGSQETSSSHSTFENSDGGEEAGDKDDEESLACSDSDEDEEEATDIFEITQVDEDEADIPIAPIEGHLACASHRYQTAITNALKDTQVEPFLKYLLSIMKFFKRSVVWSDVLKKETKLDVIIPGKTRWNANLDMLARIINEKEKFFDALLKTLKKANADKALNKNNKNSTVRRQTSSKTKKQPPAVPTAEDFKKAKELHALLRPMGDGTDRLQREGPTSNHVVPTAVLAYKSLLAIKCTYFEKFRRILLNNIVKYMGPFVRNMNYCVAGALDPCQKLLPYKVPETWVGQLPIENPDDDLPMVMDLRLRSIDEIKDTLKAFVELDKRGGCNEQSADVNESPSAPKKARQEKNDDQLNRFYALLYSAEDDEDDEVDPVTLYFAEKVDKTGVCPLQYWKEKEKDDRFHSLAQIARKYFAIPASSGGVERLFSVAGMLSSMRRTKTKISTMANILNRRFHREASIVRKMGEVNKYRIAVRRVGK